MVKWAAPKIHAGADEKHEIAALMRTSMMQGCIALFSSGPNNSPHEHNI